MQKYIKSVVLVLIAALIQSCNAAPTASSPTSVPPISATATSAPITATDESASAAFVLTSPSLGSDGKFTPEQAAKGYGCMGENLSPSLNWTGAPEGTKSFAVTFLDEYGVSGSGFWHWTIFNIPASVSSLPEDAGDVSRPLAPEGSIQGRNDSAAQGFLGPCPPKGSKPRNYTFTVWALKTETIPFDKNSFGPSLNVYLQQNALAKASLTIVHSR
jgi:Raf kinase inhibitor-like YbhB/YbcL family protein